MGWKQLILGGMMRQLEMWCDSQGFDMKQISSLCFKGLLEGLSLGNNTVLSNSSPNSMKKPVCDGAEKT